MDHISSQKHMWPITLKIIQCDPIQTNCEKYENHAIMDSKGQMIFDFKINLKILMINSMLCTF